MDKTKINDKDCLSTLVLGTNMGKLIRIGHDKFPLKPVKIKENQYICSIKG